MSKTCTAGLTETATTDDAAVATKQPKAKKAKPETAVADKPAKTTGLTETETKILKLLKAAKSPLSRKQLSAKTGIQKGWSRMLGAGTKDDGGSAGKDSLEGRGLIKSQVDPEGGRALLYVLTKKGEQVLAKATA